MLLRLKQATNHVKCDNRYRISWSDRCIDGLLMHLSLPVSWIQNASKISRVTFSLNFPKIWTVVKSGLHPHLDTCTARFPEGDAFKEAWCSLNLSCTHLPVWPMYTLVHDRGIWYTTPTAHLPKLFVCLFSHSAFLFWALETRLHNWEYLQGAEKTTGILYLVATFFKLWDNWCT